MSPVTAQPEPEKKDASPEKKEGTESKKRKADEMASDNAPKVRNRFP